MKEKKEDIQPKNKKGQFHGYQERYFINNLVSRYTGKNGRRIGYYEWHASNFRDIKVTRFFIR